MNRRNRWQSLLLACTLIATLLANSAGVALAQAPADPQSGALYLPLVSGARRAVQARKPPETDQIIIHYAAPAPDQARSQPMEMSVLSEAAGVTLDYVRQLADESVVVRLPQPLAPAELDPLLARIAQLPDVAVAEPDTRVVAQAIPNDPRYGEQWHYFPPTAGNYGVNLPGAWDISTGAANMVVAVLDTGQLNHADLAGRTVAGYDFITDIPTANDGDGRDADPSDPGDWDAIGNSSWHGTHVAGTIGAKSNNATGVAGVNWGSKIQPIRVLGVGGGDISDITDAIRWAAGLSVPGAPANPTPAKVLNLSLGGPGVCGITLQNAIDAAVNAGAVVVVSAGNNIDDVVYYHPANCKNVITVAATDRDGDMAVYSNAGSLVEISAPGGETGFFPTPDGILSTLNTGTTTPLADSYDFYMGTSMAAPHVAGIASLLFSVRSTLTPAQVLSIIQTTATPFPAGSWCHTNNCGSGIINAAAAVAVAQSRLLPPSNLQARAPAANQIQLTWSDNTSDETGFRVERCQGPECMNFSQIATLGANVRNYLDTGLATNTHYRYRVVATRNGASSPPSLATMDTTWAAGCTVIPSTDIPKAIQDFSPTESTLTVAGHITLTDVNVRYLNITHPLNFHLTGLLIGPNGTQLELFSGVGAWGGDFSDTTLDDEATADLYVGSVPFRGSYRTFYPLSVFDGQNAAGTWKLRILDEITLYEGTLNGWALEVCGNSSGGGDDGGDDGGSGGDVIFDDGFEAGNLLAWSASSTGGGDLSVKPAAALAGSQGLQAVINDNTALYLTDDKPSAEARYRTRFYFDPNSIAMANGNAHVIFQGFAGTSTAVLRVEFRLSSGNYQLRAALLNDGTTWTNSSWFTISDGAHVVELDWQASTAAGANSGSLTFWIDGVQKANKAGIDNDTRRIDRIRLGAVTGIDKGTRGTTYFDAFASRRQSYIGTAAGQVVAADAAAPDPSAEQGWTEEEAMPEEEALPEENGAYQLLLPLIDN